MPKSYSQTYLYNKYPEYNKKLFEFIMKADRIDTTSKEFEDIAYDIKRRKINDSLMKVLHSQNVHLCILPGNPLPKAFKVFTAKDVRDDKDNAKVFIDVTDCIIKKDGVYNCAHIDWVISYLIDAMTSFVYLKMENKFTGNASVLKDGGDAFVRCFSYILDRIYKITTMQTLKRRVEYCIALYYQVNILGKDIVKYEDSVKANAIRLSDIEKKDAQIVDIMLEESMFNDIDTFTAALGRMFKFKDLTVSAIVDKWMQAFGTGTVFAMEFFPAFSRMMTNTYIGGYIDQQAVIEKVAGTSMVTFTKSVIQIGSSVTQ